MAPKIYHNKSFVRKAGFPLDSDHFCWNDIQTENLSFLLDFQRQEPTVLDAIQSPIVAPNRIKPKLKETSLWAILAQVLSYFFLSPCAFSPRVDGMACYFFGHGQIPLYQTSNLI